MRREIKWLRSIRVYFIGDIWIVGVDDYVMMLDNIEEIEEFFGYLNIKLKDGDEFLVEGKNVGELKVFLERLKPELKTRGGCAAQGKEEKAAQHDWVPEPPIVCRYC
jgi:hypothetical protein